MKLHELNPPAGSHQRRKIVGRGPGSGHGKTSGRGEKGQKARSGGSSHPWFEGGQLPLHRRVPKRGFVNIFRKEYAVLNVKDLERFAAGTTVSPATFVEAGLVKRAASVGVKVLGEGSLTKPLTVSAHQFSKVAAEKIRAAGGTVEVIGS
jgi:large subunit ribosomal protein L15